MHGYNHLRKKKPSQDKLQANQNAYIQGWPAVGWEGDRVRGWGGDGRNSGAGSAILP